MSGNERRIGNTSTLRGDQSVISRETVAEIALYSQIIARKGHFDEVVDNVIHSVYSKRRHQENLNRR